jgi:hypothetical protein
LEHRRIPFGQGWRLALLTIEKLVIVGFNSAVEEEYPLT